MSPLGLLKILRTCLARELYMNCLLFDWSERCATPLFDSWLLPCHSSDHVWSKDILSHQTHFCCYCFEIVDNYLYVFNIFKTSFHEVQNRLLPNGICSCYLQFYLPLLRKKQVRFIECIYKYLQRINLDLENSYWSSSDVIIQITQF